jgi:MFS family permease
LIGLGADLVSMLFLLASPVMHGHASAYVLLLAATCALGVGFGLVVPALNTFTAAFFPHAVEKSILTLNALLGLGTALAPVFAAIFLGLGFWWGLPLLMAALAIVLLLFAATLPLPDAMPPTPPAGSESSRAIPSRFWLYAAFALVYGICETINGNWSTVYMASNLGASATLASLALTVFWATVTAGRVFFAAIERWIPQRVTYCALPWLIGVALVVTAFVPKGDGLLALGCFAVAGLGCSALLPLVIGFAQEELTTMSASVAGGLIGAYQIGYGMAAFGVGPLQAVAKLSLGLIFGGTALFAIGLALLAVLLVRFAPRVPIAHAPSPLQ